jgi:hypothetical protein
MLPMVALMITGYLACHRSGGSPGQTSSGGGLGGMLGGLLGGGAAGSQGAGGFASMLDMNGDGNPLDDILRMAGGKR